VLWSDLQLAVRALMKARPDGKLQQPAIPMMSDVESGSARRHRRSATTRLRLPVTVVFTVFAAYKRQYMPGGESLVNHDIAKRSSQ
jgi:hypothetical protein